MTTRYRLNLDDLPLALVVDGEFATLGWDTEELNWSRTSAMPGVVWERNPDQQDQHTLAYARIYDSRHDEPMITVSFDAAGRATHMLVRRFPDIGTDIEDAAAGYSDDELA